MIFHVSGVSLEQDLKWCRCSFKKKAYIISSSTSVLVPGVASFSYFRAFSPTLHPLPPQPSIHDIEMEYNIQDLCAWALSGQNEKFLSSTVVSVLSLILSSGLLQPTNSSEPLMESHKLTLFPLFVFGPACIYVCVWNHTFMCLCVHRTAGKLFKACLCSCIYSQQMCVCDVHHM